MVLYFFIALLAASLLWLGLWRQPAPAGSAENGLRLQPKKFGLLRTVRNFIFSENVLEGQSNDRINILLLGMGGPGHDGPYLTDTNIIVSLKPSTKEAALISIPRDFGINLPGYGWRKINHVNAFGEEKTAGQGGEYARQIFAETFGLSIPYYVRVDFTAFQEVVDALGGLAIKAPRGFTDTMFPGANLSYQTVSFDAGAQTMTGRRALEYARSRHGNNNEGSDFARAARQQLILAALKDKLFSLGTYLNPNVLQKIFDSLAAHVSTNLDIGQMIYLANLAKDVPAINKMLVLDNSPDGFLISTTAESGAFLLLPKIGSLTDINQAIAGIFSASSASAPALSLPPPAPAAAGRFPGVKIEIQNGTWRVGLASRIRSYLENKGFSVIGVGNSLLRPVATTTVYLLSPQLNNQTLAQLRQALPAQLATVLPSWLMAEYDKPETAEDERGMKYNNRADVLIMIGGDYKE